MIDIRTNEKLQQLAIQAAEEMVAQGLDEKELTVPETDIKLFLIKDKTDKATELNAVPGAFLGASIEHSDTNFLIFRTNKTASL